MRPVARPAAVASDLPVDRRAVTPQASGDDCVALAELDASRAALAEAEVKALRAQISPHFIYNALTAIASTISMSKPVYPVGEESSGYSNGLYGASVHTVS